jgi:hypothetical protein
MHGPWHMPEHPDERDNSEEEERLREESSPLLDGHIVLGASWGNDTVATVQFLREEGLTDVTCLYNDTGWPAEGWLERVGRNPFLEKRGWPAPVTTSADASRSGMTGPSARHGDQPDSRT